MVTVAPIRKKDVSPEVWAAHKAREKAKDDARLERERIEAEAREETYRQQRATQITELRSLWQEMRLSIQSAPSLIGSFERFEQSLLSLIEMATVDELLVDDLLDDPMFPEPEVDES